MPSFTKSFGLTIAIMVIISAIILVLFVLPDSAKQILSFKQAAEIAIETNHHNEQVMEKQSAVNELAVDTKRHVAKVEKDKDEIIATKRNKRDKVKASTVNNGSKDSADIDYLWEVYNSLNEGD